MNKVLRRSNRVRETPCSSCASSAAEPCLACQLQPENYVAVKDVWLDHRDDSLRIPESAPVEWAMVDLPDIVVARWDAAQGQWQSCREDYDGVAPLMRFLWLEITTHCPHQCRHCYLGNRLNRGHAPLSMIDAGLEAAKPWCPTEIVLSGGEPTMHPRFLTILQQSLDAAPGVRVLTNGWTQRAEVVRALAHPRISVEIPLLGNETVHDWMTQTPRSYARIRRSLALYVNAGVHVTLTTTVTRQTLPTLPDLRALAQELGIVFAPTPLSPQGRAADHWEDLRVIS